MTCLLNTLEEKRLSLYATELPQIHEGGIDGSFLGPGTCKTGKLITRNLGCQDRSLSPVGFSQQLCRGDYYRCSAVKQSFGWLGSFLYKPLTKPEVRQFCSKSSQDPVHRGCGGEPGKPGSTRDRTQTWMMRKMRAGIEAGQLVNKTLIREQISVPSHKCKGFLKRVVFWFSKYISTSQEVPKV